MTTDDFYKYRVWIRINDYQTTETIVIAKTDYDAKMLAEAQYGVGNVLNYTRID
jgi:hypothetical protein